MEATVCMDEAYTSGLNVVKPHVSEMTGFHSLCLNPGMAKKKGHAKPAPSEVEAIARRLREGRMAMGIDQADFCRRAGIATNTYNNWEREKGAPSRLEARKLKKAFGWTLDYIFEGDLAGMPHAIASKLTA